MTELFIKKATLIHDDTYDYSKVEYKNARDKIIIICKQHGEFEQSPNNHLSKNGCIKCVDRTKRKSNIKEFIEKAILIHGDKYNYSKVNYINSNTNIIIICNEHGEFEQKPSNHLSGKQCSKCSGVYKLNTNEFIEKSKLIHGDKYDYSKVIYVDCKTKGIIICKKHGEFLQSLGDHHRGTGCDKCQDRGGSQRYNTEQFIKKAILKHGDAYDYSKVNYINSLTKIIIICKEHGEFEQNPTSHLVGCGCKICKGIYLSNTNEFIKKAILIHGDKYNYSKVNYINSLTKIKIICKEHEEFEQQPSSHLAGRGCNKCADILRIESKTYSQEEFIKHAIIKHGDNYDYSKVKYTKSNIPIVILCKIHGMYEQMPFTHLAGSGCSICGINNSAKSRSYTREEFIEKSIIKHDNNYDYSNINYINTQIPITIICKKHGEFIQNPAYHLSGNGCSQCVDRGSTQRYNTEQFIEKAILKHGNIYDYSKVNYINSLTKIKIICKEHGEFNQMPSSHLVGTNCPKCCQTNCSKTQIQWLNFISALRNNHIIHALNDGEYVIPNTKFKADGYCKETNTIYEFHGHYWHGNPKLYNANKINKTVNCTFGELYKNTLLREEQIKDLGYSLVVMWESDWNKINKSIKTLQQQFKIKYL